MTSPASGWLSGGPWRQGVAVISTDGRPGCFEPCCLPGLKSAGGAAEALCACRRRDDDARGGKQRASGRIEVVVVMVVGEQDRVDRWKVGRRDCGSGELARRRAPAEVVRLTWRIERGIGQYRPAVNVDQDGGSTDVRDADACHTARVVAPAAVGSLTWLRRHSKA